MSEKVLRAVSEWERYAGTCAGAKPVRFVLSAEDSPGRDGFSVVADGAGAVVTSESERGLLYGAYAVIDSCRLAGGRFAAANTRETPDFPLRMIWSWGRLDNSYLHSPYLSIRSLLSYENIGDPESNAGVMRFIRHLASMRVNALTLTYDLHLGGLPSLDQHIYRPYYAQLGKFARYLKEWGVDLYIFMNATPEKEFYRQNDNATDCPFDPVYINFWRDFTTEISRDLPDIAGLMLSGSLGGVSGGRLYGCDCEYCKGKSPVEKIREQIYVVADMLECHGKQLVYDLTTDRPDMLYREVEVVLALAGDMPDNAILTFKNHFQDFEELRYPEHPVFSRLEELCPETEAADLKIAAQMQLFPEMRGKSLILSNVTEIWRDEISRLRALGAKGIAGVVETHPDDAHPSMAEWYAWGRLAWNSRRQTNDLLAEWTKLNYPAGVDAILPDILRGSYMAASNTIYAGGLQCAAHGMLCPSPAFLKHALNETWYRGDEPAGFDMLGVDDEPLSLYTEKRRKEITENPRMFLLTKAYKITDSLYDRLMVEKDAAVAQYKALAAQWRTAAPLFAPDDYRYRALSEMLERNVGDARRFRTCLSLFWRYHMGALKENEIADALTELLSSDEPCSINTCNESVKLFFERLRMLLAGIPFDARFNNMVDLPQITESGWEEGAVKRNA